MKKKQNNTWVKIYRKIIDNPIYKSSSGIRVWLHCLLSATHTKYKIDFAGEEIELKKGEFVYGRYEWGKITRINPNTVENWISKLVKRNMLYVERRVRGYGSILGISKWEDYQTQRAIKRANNERITSGGRAVGINKKDKKDKKDKKRERAPTKKKNDYSLIENVLEKDMDEIAEHYKVPIAFVKSKYEDMIIWAGERTNNPKTRNRNWRLTLMSWVKKDAIKIRKEAGGGTQRIRFINPK